eukprot:TRINITY_DN587_c0_g1_i6.p1 TRINITY_DN587_c0_g1~~TRINITY_DN587_c0_g1_i6.p1  ORF type:complete len:261 (-),score=37.72 TRINITY_DN587_c0_g1_i6:498-1280(-)
MAAAVQQDFIGFAHNSTGVLPASKLDSRTHASPCRRRTKNEPERSLIRLVNCTLVLAADDQSASEATVCKSSTHDFRISGAYFIQEGADVRIRQHLEKDKASEFALIDVHERAPNLHTRMYVWMLRKYQFQQLRARWLESADRVLQSPHEHNLLALSDCASQPPPQLGAFPNELFFAATIVPHPGAVGKPHKRSRAEQPPSAVQQQQPRRRALATGQQLAVEQQFWPFDAWVHRYPSLPVQQLNMEELLLLDDDAALATP